MIQSAAKEAFLVLRSYDYNVVMYDEDGGRVYEPEQARRLYASEGIMVGMIDDGDDSTLKLAIGPSIPVGSVKGLSDTLRNTAVKFNMLYNLIRTAREMSAKEYANALGESKGETSMNYLVEGMYGTNKSSYLKLENARLIVRHTKKVDETVRGSRARNIDKIFVENAQGERYLFPTTSLPPARAMAQHVNQGGTFADQVGAQIARMAQDFGSLSAGCGYIEQNAGALVENALGLTSHLVECRKAMRETFRRLSSSRFYEDEAARLAEMITENDDTGPTADDIRGLLAVEGVELDETMVGAIVEAMRGKEYDCQRKCLQEEDNMVKVLHQEIPEIAWEKLKAGDIELVGEVEQSRPMSKTVEGLLAEKLNAIINAMSDSDPAFRVLSVAYTIINDVEEDSNKGAALKLANIVVQKNYPKTKLSKDLNEFAVWVNDNSVSRLMEMGMRSDYDSTVRGEQSEDEMDVLLSEKFDVDGFIQACADGEYNSVFHADASDLDAEDKSYSEADLVSDMRHFYVSRLARDNGVEFDAFDDYVGETSPQEVRIAVPDVISRFEKGGHIINRDDITEKLDSSDLDLEFGQAEDFENEILSEPDPRLPRF